MEAQSYSALIIDPLDTEHYIGLAKRYPTRLAQSGAEAVKAICDPVQNFSAVFIHPQLSKPGMIQTLSLLHKHRPLTPIFVLFDEDPPFTQNELSRLAIVDLIQKPLTLPILKSKISSKILGIIVTPITTFEKSEENPEFIPVCPSDTLSGAPSFFDLFIKLPSGRQVKILEARDTLTPERALGYISKGVPYFYIRKEIQKRSIDYCTVLAHSLLQRKDISLEVKISETLNQGQSIIELIQEKGLDNETLDSTNHFLMNVHALIKTSALDQPKALKTFLSHLEAYDHALATTMTAALLSEPLKIQSLKAFETIGLASFLHDIALYELPPHLQSHDESLMNEEEKKAYHEHPLKGAEMVSKFEDIDATTLQAIAQHHERRNKKGFPGKVSPTEINRIAEIVGLSDEFVRLYSKLKKENVKDPKQTTFLVMERNKIFDGFSYPIVEAFQNVFMG